MKPFFFYLLLGLTGCASLSGSFLLEDPRMAMMSVTIQTPQGKRTVVELPNFSRLESIWDTLECEGCDLRNLNPHQILKNGDVIILRSVAGLTVSLNQATLEDLMFLPGIGKVLAQRIIDYRNEHGFFQRVEDIMLVRGIKDGLLSKIKPYLVL
jgi:competence protein ComEA